MRGRKIVTDGMSLYIARDFVALRIYGHSRKEATSLVRDDVSKEFDKQISEASVNLHADSTPEQIRQKRRKYERKMLAKYNPSYVEFSECFEGFEKGTKKPINPDNEYLRALVTLSRHGSPIKGRYLAQDLKLSNVTKQLRFLKEKGLIEHPTVPKTVISSEGKTFLKFLGLG